MLRLLGAAALLAGSVASYHLPDRAEGGLFWQWRYGENQAGLQEAPARTWDAPVDHFAVSDETSTYRQRFFIDDRFFDRSKGLVFLDIGGEGTINGPPGGYIAELGQKYGALLVALEHRFYGESVPNKSMTTENLRYLTVEQALADVAAFSDFLKVEVGLPNLRFFTFGGSYPGALSAWYRVAYPEKTIGSLSSSGVVNAIIDFPEFDEQVAEAIGESCAAMVRNVTAAFERGLKTDAARTKAIMGVDEGMWDPDFFYMLADSAAMADQYGNKRWLCDALAAMGPADDHTLMRGFANFTTTYWGPKFATSCFYDSRCGADAVKATVNERSWRWQKCHQLAYFQVAPKSGSLRSSQVDLEYAAEQCRRIFGTSQKPETDAINARYGGKFPKGTRIFLSDFSDDPWQQASVRYEESEDLPYALVKCDGCGHCMDLHAPKPTDPEPLKAARARFEEYLDLWLTTPEV